MSARVIIIGAGQIGIACAEHFSRSGCEVAVLSRSENMLPIGGIDHLTADRSNFGQLERAVGSGADLLIDTVAFDAPDSEQLIRLQDRLGAIAVVSSASVYCDQKRRTLDEASANGFPVGMEGITESHITVKPGPATYSTRKVAMERALAKGAPAKSIILRPCAIHGPYSRHPREWWFVKRMLDGRKAIPLSNGGMSRFQTTSAASIASVLFDIMSANQRGTFNCADADSPTVSDIGRAVATAMGANVEFIPLANSNPSTMGRTPWSVPLPFTVSIAKATKLGVGNFKTYSTAVEPAIRWLEGVDSEGWQHRFPDLAAYPWDMFDYDAEDIKLSTAHPHL
jgi:nucleoside-diphosphate-sugar epimerase